MHAAASRPATRAAAGRRPEFTGGEDAQPEDRGRPRTYGQAAGAVQPDVSLRAELPVPASAASRRRCPAAGNPARMPDVGLRGGPGVPRRDRPRDIGGLGRVRRRRGRWSPASGRPGDIGDLGRGEADLERRTGKASVPAAVRGPPAHSPDSVRAGPAGVARTAGRRSLQCGRRSGPIRRHGSRPPALTLSAVSPPGPMAAAVAGVRRRARAPCSAAPPAGRRRWPGSSTAIAMHREPHAALIAGIRAANPARRRAASGWIPGRTVGGPLGGVRRAAERSLLCRLEAESTYRGRFHFWSTAVSRTSPPCEGKTIWMRTAQAVIEKKTGTPPCDPAARHGQNAGMGRDGGGTGGG